MLAIRAALREDINLLKTLIDEMGEYERLPVSITEETLAHDGFGGSARAPRSHLPILIINPRVTLSVQCRARLTFAFRRSRRSARPAPERIQVGIAAGAYGPRTLAP